MTKDMPLREALSFPLVESGFDHSLARRYGRSRPTLTVRLARVVLLVLITWIPLLLISLVAGHAFQGTVDVPLLHDPSMYGRFFFVLPVLEMAEVMVAISLTVQVRHFLQSEIVPASDRDRFDAAVHDVVKTRTSPWTEIGIAVVALLVAFMLRLTAMHRAGSSWDRLDSSMTLAGWWYTLISLPILLFFILRWLVIFCLWSWFLFRVSRLDLRLTPTHPDHAGGLGFLGWGLASFSTVLMAVSAVFSAGFAHQILHKNQSLDSLKYHIITFIVIAIVVIHVPLTVFALRLSRCRFRGLLDYSYLVLRHDRAFDEKWIDHIRAESESPLLGSPDIQSLADVATAYDHVNEMRLLPFDKKAFFVLVVSALAPMLPLVATEIPLQEILPKLVELLG